MVDRHRRDQFAELLRSFAAGSVQNFEFERRLDAILDRRAPKHWADPGLRAIHQCSWFLYDDLRAHFLAGRWKLAKGQRREVAVWILFLHSDFEYRWPHAPLLPVGEILLSLLTLGWWATRQRREFQTLPNAGLWPFFSAEEYRFALEHPKLMAKAG